jgi:hypothetical protein
MEPTLWMCSINYCFFLFIFLYSMYTGDRAPSLRSLGTMLPLRQRQRLATAALNIAGSVSPSKALYLICGLPPWSIVNLLTYLFQLQKEEETNRTKYEGLFANMFRQLMPMPQNVWMHWRGILITCQLNKIGHVVMFLLEFARTM